MVHKTMGEAPRTANGAGDLAVPVSFTGRVWYVVMTAPQREFFAHRNLVEGGFSAWLPVQTVQICHANKRRLERRPFFPGYLFVGLAGYQAFAPITTMPGVAAVIRGEGSRPLEIRQATLNRVAAELAAHEAETLARLGGRSRRPVNPFKPGQRLRVDEGPLAGLTGICTKPAGERTVLLLQFLGREAARPTTVPTNILRVAE